MLSQTQTVHLENVACQSRPSISPFHTQRQSLLSSQFNCLCSENPGTEGRQGEDPNGPGFSQPSQMESPQLHLQCVLSRFMENARGLSEVFPSACSSPVWCPCRERHLTPSFPSIAMTKYPRQPMYQEEGFIWEHSFRGLNLQSKGLEAAHHDGQCLLEKAAYFIGTRK